MKSKVISPDNDFGILPKEIKYDQENQKYFVYGDQKILVFDANYVFIEDIEISKYGHAYPWARTVEHVTYKNSYGNQFDFRDNRMAFDTENNNILYCVTEDLKFLIINTVDNTIEYSKDFEAYNSPELENFGVTLLNCQVVFNHRNNKVWWIINDWIHIGIYSELRAKVFEYDPSDQVISEVLVSSSGNITDLLIHPTRDIYYVSLLSPGVLYSQVFSKVFIRNFNHETIRYFDIDTYNKEVFFIHHFDYIGNEVFCYPYHKTKMSPSGDEDYSEIFRIDGIDDDAEIKKSILQIVLRVTCSFYNQETNRLYLGYQGDLSQGGINLYEYFPDDDNLPLLYTISLYTKPLKFVENQTDDIIYCGLKNTICGLINEIELFYVGYTPYYFMNNHILDIFYDDNNQKLIGINFMGGSIEFLNPTDLSHDQSIYVGSFMPKGIYCPVSDECYFFNQNDMTNNKLGIFNNNTYDLSFENYNDRIQKVEYDFINQALYIAKEDKILIYDVLNHEFYEEEIIIQNTEVLLDMVFAPDENKLTVLLKQFWGNGYEVHIFDASGFPNLVDLVDPPIVIDLNEEVHKTFGLYNQDLNELYFSLSNPNVGDWGTMICIDLLTNSLEFRTDDIIKPEKIIYNPVNGHLYINSFEEISSNYIESIAVLNRNIITDISYFNIGNHILDIAYSDYLDYVYVTSDDGYLRFIECEDERLADPGMYISSTVSDLCYNSDKSKLYIHIPAANDAAQPFEEQLFILDDINNSLTNIGLDQYEKTLFYYKYGNTIVFPEMDLVYNNFLEKVYMTNGHSTISIIDENTGCDEYVYENYTFQSGDVAFWDDKKYIERFIVLENGSQLTIHAPSTVFFKTGAKIVVQNGAKLIVDGAILTKSCTGYWNGIEVWGIISQNQFPDEYGNFLQGYVHLTNGAVIEYAKTAILTAQVDFPVMIDKQTSGGIIIAKNTTFNNNIVALEFLPFENIHPGTAEEHQNFSSFNDCSFNIDEDYPYQMNEFESHIKLGGVNGINFTGCEFNILNTLNKSTSVPQKMVYLEDCNQIYFKGCTFLNAMAGSKIDPEDRGIGLYAYNSSIFVLHLCTEYDQEGNCINYNPSNFNKFTHGIYAMGIGIDKPFKVDTSIFNNNVYGLYVNGINYAEILSNQFNLQTNINNNNKIYGLYLYESDGYHVENNLFLSEPGIEETVGLVVNNSGDGANEIYRNYFSNLSVGIECINDNRGEGTGLCLKCNFSEANERDYLVTGIGTSNPEGIAQAQGIYDPASSDATLPAGNTFSTNDDHDYDLDNGALQFDYVYHGSNNSDYRIEPLEDKITGLIELKENTFAVYDLELTTCLSRISSGGTPETLKSEMLSYDTTADSLQTELSTLIDGGDTEDMNLDVVFSQPNEALEIKQQLMEESPYLSDTVMKSAIQKEDVLPNAMIRDILVANPQSAKSNSVLGALDGRWDPMPDYMMEEIMDGEDSLAGKEILERKILGYRFKSDQVFNSLTSVYLSDSVNTWARDSLETLLQTKNTLKAEYRLAFMYLANDDTVALGTVLNNIQDTLNLNAQQLQTHDDYLTYINILKEVKYDTTDNFVLDSIQIATLSGLVDTVNNLPSAYARNLLVHYGIIKFKEPFIIPDSLKSATIYQLPDNTSQKQQETYFEVYPNPANTYIIIEYNIGGVYNEILFTINDLNGRKIKDILVRDNRDQVVVPLQNMKQGVYIISLYIDNTLKDSKKIALIK